MSDYKIEIEIYEGKGGHLQKRRRHCHRSRYRQRRNLCLDVWWRWGTEL